MILLNEYFGDFVGHKDATDVVVANAKEFLSKVNSLLDTAVIDGVDLRINPVTGNHISGKTYGGFRPQDCKQGAPTSSHKEGRGVDIYDPDNSLDDWCFRHQGILKLQGLYMEHPQSTLRWCHLTDRAPASKKTVFFP